MSKFFKSLSAAIVGLSLIASHSALAETVIKVQSVLPTKSDEIVMVKDFAANVAALTNGEVKIEVLPVGLLSADATF